MLDSLLRVLALASEEMVLALLPLREAVTLPVPGRRRRQRSWPPVRLPGDTAGCSERGPGEGAVEVAALLGPASTSAGGSWMVTGVVLRDRD